MKAHGALVPRLGHHAGVHPDSDRVTPPAIATALTMLATTAHGDAYTFADYDGIFSKAGFARNEFHALPPTAQQAVVSYKSRDAPFR